ncbi:uncharacterized protein LOC132727411 [Ruditapes philippinarum]|uniref:uncharacterized protein LOC132727411 n=1 Tax=Ruditapes philippinarum TaxID=129788 RepID=UPI00295BED96|nr:uncharacterized protein LOC132727411 [Ruditapes philippinarum]
MMSNTFFRNGSMLSKMYTKGCCLFYILLFSDIGAWTNMIQLTPTRLYAVENSSATLTCSKTNEIMSESLWFNSQISGDANLFYSNGKCNTSRFLHDSDFFSGVCNNNGTYSVVLKKIDRTQHGAEWMCSELLSMSNKVVIEVSVPATSVTLSQQNGDYMKENQNKNISCSTSACRPEPRVQWYLRNSNNQIINNLTQFSTNRYVNGEYGLRAVNSVLHLRPNRTINNLHLYCEVRTRFDKADILSRDVSVNVTYPPDISPVIHGVETNDPLSVIVSDKGAFVCSVTGGNPLASLEWNCFDSQDITMNTQESTVTSTVKWTALRNYSTCSCTSHHTLSNWKRITNLTVHVQFPPTKPHFKIGQTDVFGVVRVIQNNTLRVACYSESNPLSNYTWIGPGFFSDKGDTIEITSVKLSNQGNYKCVASNRMIRTNGSYEDGSHTSSLNLTVLYPPSKPKFKFENSSGQLIQSNIFYVVRNDTFSIYCDVKGNPDPDIKWDDNKSNPRLSISNIYLDINSTCRATNLMKEFASQIEIISKSEAPFSIIVLYPPGPPTIHVSNDNGDSVQVQNGNVSIIESETINVKCFSTSKPMPTYKWIHEQYIKTQSTNVLKFVNINRRESGRYACNVENIMKRSIGKTEVGKDTSQLILNVLYPAIVNDIDDVSIVEGSQLETVCPVVYGNPSTSIVTWSRQGEESLSNNRLLFIKNVSRADNAMYTCSVITEMFPTIGTDLKAERRNSFHLNVFFPSEINKFTISTVSSGRTFLVNETQKPYFECIAEANPPSDLNIKSPRGDYIIEVSQSNIARHTFLRNATYKDAGEYICSGRNNYTTDSPSQSKLILIVKSQPRPSSGDTSVMKVATVLNVDVTLPFIALNYLDEPNKTMFRWFKENVSIPENDNKYLIHSNDLQTNITIRNTTQRDLGLYKVDVENSVGMFTQYYELKATDKPERPVDFRVMNDSITDTMVTLAWSPGFNGGFQQTFVILYKVMQEHIWLNKSIKDNGDFNMNYTLNDLSSLQEYEIEMFARNIEGNSFHTNRLHFKTKEQQKSQVKSPTEDKSGIIAGSVAAVVVVVIVLVVVIFIYRKRRNKSTDSLYQNVPFFGQKNNRKQNVINEAKKKRRNCPTNETTFEEKSSRRKQSINGEVRKRYTSEADEHVVEGLQEVDDVPIIVNERTEYCNSPDKIDNIDRITVAELHAYVSGNDDSLEAEYQKLPTGLQKSCTFARKPEKLALNRYNGIYPYDHSRVKIPEDPDFFINACYINGYRKKKAYIASLGPTSKTTSDFKTFWQMVWHERSDMIIMLTKLHEPSGMKCEKYWPNKGTDQQYGDVIVTCETYEAFAEYTIRTFRVSKGNQHRSLKHLHYTAWPDKTVPEDVTSLLDFRKRMKDVPITQGGPIIIHCSAGIGRTGTLIALDILIEEGQDKDSVNVFECVDNLRTQRVKMVQTVEQYIYIHKCLVNALSYAGESILKERIHEQVYNRNDKQYITLFKQLNSSVETDNSSEQKARLKNRNYSNKNRQEADVPGDRYIVFLNLTDGREGSEYINAVYVNSFKRKDHFIVAQSPLPNTVTDFVSMIFQEDCSCIATMEDLKEPGMTVGTYLSEMNKKAIFGNFQVSSSQLEETSAYIIRKVKIKYTNKNADGEKCFYHFQYKNWMTGSKTPGNVADFVNFISEVEEYANELGEDRSRVVVHCLKANERSCLFCAVAIIIEKLKVEGKVNILNVIRHLRTRRRTAIVSKEQLKFCYEAASAYIKQNKH